MGTGLLIEVMEDGVVAVTGELSLAEAPILERRLAELVQTRPARLVVDLAGVSFIDSTGLSVLVRAQQQAGDRGTEFGVVNPTAQANRLLSLTGLDERLLLGTQTGSRPQGSGD